MDDWYKILNARSEPSASALQELSDAGFLIISGPVSPDQLPEFAYAYDSALASANTGDISIGRSTTRVDDFVNRGPEFDRLYTFRPLLAACCRVIRQPFKLSTMHARDVRPHSKAQDLHVDFPRDEAGWPMVGFIRSICWISKIEDSAGWNEDRITGFTRIFKKEKENKVMARQLDFPIV